MNFDGPLHQTVNNVNLWVSEMRPFQSHKRFKYERTTGQNSLRKKPFYDNAQTLWVERLAKGLVMSLR